METSRRAVLAAPLLGLFAPAIARAATPITAVLTAGADGAPLFVATRRGMFARRGIEMTPRLIPLMPSMPAMLVSKSAQIGFMTTTTMLQAVDGGLDLVVAAGGAVTSPRIADAAVIARPGIEIKRPEDFIGRTVGVPGLGAYYHVIFRWWLIQNDVNPAKVHFVETAFPSMLDALRGGSVDAVVTLDPFQSEILGAHAGHVVEQISADVPADKPVVLYVATSDWARANHHVLEGFRAAIAEAQTFTEKHPQEALEDLNYYVKLPPRALKHAVIGAQSRHVTEVGLGWWVAVMHQQGMLPERVDITKMLVY